MLGKCVSEAMLDLDLLRHCVFNHLIAKYL